MIIDKTHLAIMTHVDGCACDKFLLNVNLVSAAVNASSEEAQINWASYYWLLKVEEAGLVLSAFITNALYTAASTDIWINVFVTNIVPLLNTNVLVL